MRNEPFGTRLRAIMDARGPLCVGIDPHQHLLDQWGLPDTAEGLASFTYGVVDALADRVGVFKPQSAFFERFGSAGVAVLEQATIRLREAGALVIIDAKRGDIGTTMAGYASAYLAEKGPLACDALTVSPYLGFGSLQPAIDEARAAGAGLFVLALTSNPEGPQFQSARTVDGPTVAGAVLDGLRSLNDADGSSFGSFGAVVGATISRTDEDLDIRGPLLAPGLGAQGGTAEALRAVFGEVAARNVVPSSSREILGAGPNAAGLQEAADRANDAYRTALGY
ncbi:orotidine-5'-phosphate decarboxylase [Kribbella antibiotica]|uniref:Orotidine 5'-phosphate decarboxylase n=1 Tax=Kribbella antibiotica TaxID=190195 RepID=A0A4R4ZSX8_9ACTN|nr:orotidine-5'-phosphate decarboxylase [Kribbella antibiotica]TDD61214.1 orotidine-5'-phosphate decarboxylase [Kribbella antibiotica]